ncbi:hypothetical protein [Streptomyces sp. C10-9-1]|uniref:hypothetical protein n=1 Tax=Streptomyces sp. C10-9-1 TaxID=1859285 RepID=UPI003F49D374
MTAHPEGTVPDAVAAVIAAQAEAHWYARTAVGAPSRDDWLAIGLAAVAELRGAGWHIRPLPDLEVPTVTHTPCPSCRQPKGPGQYLCLDCWTGLPAASRAALRRRDRRAMARLRELHTQLEAGRRPAEVRIPS